MRSLAAALVSAALALLTTASSARAERDLIVPFHEAGHIVLDRVSGLHAAADGVSYAGPAGIAVRQTSIEGAGDAQTTTMWIAPSADVFLADHLSVGGFVEVAHTFGSASVNRSRLELPGATSMTVLPRVGFYAPFGDRFGLWPRVGVGYTRSQSVSFPSAGGSPTTDTFRSALLDVDLSLVYRFNEWLFLSAGPEVGVTFAGRRASDANGTSSAAGESQVTLGGTIAFGVNLE